MHTKDYILGMHFIYINIFAIDISVINKVLQALKVIKILIKMIEIVIKMIKIIIKKRI